MLSSQSPFLGLWGMPIVNQFGSQSKPQSVLVAITTQFSIVFPFPQLKLRYADPLSTLAFIILSRRFSVVHEKQVLPEAQ